MRIEVRDIGFAYKYSDRQVLHDINLCFDSSEKTVLLGANGCGKTTLLKVLCGLFAPNRGSILLNGKEVKSKPSFNFLVGLVPENPEEMFFESTVEREIAFILKRKKEKDIDKKVESIMHHFDLYKIKDSSPFEISSGEKRKLAIASVMVAEQQFVLLDEPISGLDWSGVNVVEDWITNYNFGIIATTHRTDFARKFDRIILMNNGHILADNLNLDDNRELLEKSDVLLLWR